MKLFSNTFSLSVNKAHVHLFIRLTVSIFPFNLYFPNATELPELSGKYHSHGSTIGIKFNIYLHTAQLQHW